MARSRVEGVGGCEVGLAEGGALTMIGSSNLSSYRA